MHDSTRNLLYDRPELYELIYPEPDEGTPKFCLRAWGAYLPTLPGSVLDIGCGTARDLNVLSRQIPDCWGVDFQERAIAYAQQLRPHLRLAQGDMRSLHLGRTFDAIISFGSTLLYALEQDDLTATVASLVRHAHRGTLLLLDLTNASAFLPGGRASTSRTLAIDVPGFTATAQHTITFDRLRQHLIRERVWTIPGAPVVSDFCRYRMLFPQELRALLTTAGFEVLGMWDTQQMTASDLTGPTLYVAARLR